MAVAGCEPVGGLDAVTVAVTTQKLAAGALDHEGVKTAWLNCHGKAENGGPDGGGATQPVTVVGVDCEGRTDTGKKIIVFGRVTGITGQSCVRGLLTAKVDGRTVFSLSVLGDCGHTGGDKPPGQPKPPDGPRPPDGPKPPSGPHVPAPGPSASCTDKAPVQGK
ncbi:hypothetical protein [Streptomyces griseocarneus]|uniref:hypothetical protein n=1 Tax=Streptomyces griseocarneus TaxID=51201 RepID=UPI00167D2040|nr:hypothetical protein [Streptomyces griseocarneus]MBZ6472337.1 hypothetical protein [Streptomyces griseocarneus]GHG72541.1 hypothetical protein GCM10018779_47980 [Streptomyces griseocarneus]